MSNTKKVLYIFTVIIMILLITCTFMSRYVAVSLEPVVEVVNPVRTELIVSEKTSVYNTVIPYAAVISDDENKSYIYIARERQGLFGIEYYVKFLEVEIEAVDDANTYAALKGWLITIFDNVVMSSSKGLSEGEIVKINWD